MNEIQLKYGCNPNQKPSRIFMEDGSDLPVTVLNGKPFQRLAAGQGAEGSYGTSRSHFF